MLSSGSDACERSVRRQIQECLRGFPKSRNPYQEFYAWGNSVNVWSCGRWEQVTGGIHCGFRPRGKSRLTCRSVISFNIKIAFAADGENIRHPIAEVLLCAAAGDLAQSKKQRDWTSRNAVLLPPFLTEAAILYGELDEGELLKIFSRSITEWASDAAPSSEANEASDDNSIVTVKAAEAKKLGKTKQASAETASAKTKKLGKEDQTSSETAAAETLASITDDCDDVLAFLLAVIVKSP